MNKKRLFGYLFVLVSVGNISAQESRLSAQEYKLWYDRPAQVWTEALPLGNGRLGAIVYGTPATEQIQLNEETIWAGRPNNNANPNALEYIPRVRDLVFAGKYLEAQTLATEKVMAKTNALSKLWRPANRVSWTYPLHELLPGTKSRLCPYPRPL